MRQSLNDAASDAPVKRGPSYLHLEEFDRLLLTNELEGD